MPDPSTVQPGLDADLTLAHELADLADQITLSRFQAADLAVSTKPDDTPVTDADREVERVLRAAVAVRRPGDAVLGEEEGGRLAERTWVIDPIDGTKNFLRGVPVWATLIGLLDAGIVPLGLVSAPSLGRRWWAAAGRGAWTTLALPEAGSPRRLQVSGVLRLDDAFVSYSSLHGWRERSERLEGLLAAAWRARGFGDFWSYMLVAEGACDIAGEPELALHDMVALAPIVTEAGGRFTDLDGAPGPFGGSALATNGHLHEEVLAALRR